ncbi:MAG: replication protein [Nitrospirota bacterium]
MVANPQKENGYTAIANELVEAFMRLNLSQHGWRILFCIIRYSYGWNKKTAKLTCTQIAKLTGIDVRLVPRTLRILTGKNIVIREGNTFRLQKDYHRWISSVEMKPSSVEMSSVQMKKFICRDEDSSSVQMKSFISTDEKNPRKCSNSNRLRGAKDILKDIPKDIYKDISLREILLKRLKTYFPYASIPANVPAKRIDFFLYLVEQNKINPATVQNPVKYMQSHKLILEPFPSLLKREAERERLEREKAEELKKQREECERFREENLGKMQQLVKSFRVKLGRKNAV